ncbi:MAG: SPOR domain-containing protein, partial [Candidatus Binatia bacterium]
SKVEKKPIPSQRLAAKTSDIKTADKTLTPNSANAMPSAKPTESQPAVKKPSEIAAIVLKSDIAAAADVTRAQMPAPEAQVKQAPVPPAKEQLALVRNKPAETPPDKKPLLPPAPRALEGYVIQVSFNNLSEAQRWADTLGRRGYAVSITETGTARSLRVRIGNFAIRDEAERQLRNLKQDGLTGIVVNLPHAYRPEVRSSLP